MKRRYIKGIAFTFLLTSIFFFVLGLLHPIMETGYGIGPIRLSREYIYLGTSFQYFLDKGEWFVGVLLLFFTIIFPIIKYIFLLLTMAGTRLPRHTVTATILEVINKWAMLDVFVVALLIMNLKFDADIITSKLHIGTTYFAVSVVLMMICSFITGRLVKPVEQSPMK